MLLINPYRFAAPRGPVEDADALAYIAAVETADGQSLEAAVQYAYEDFILGCKSDGLWSAIKASCILAGARTLNGALVPLVGAAPTNFNFVTADYTRGTGLKGNSSTKYLASGRDNTDDPQNSKHIFCYATESLTRSGNACPIGRRAASGTGWSVVVQGPSGATYHAANSAINATYPNGTHYPLGGWGISRNNSANFDFIFRNTGSVAETGTISIASLSPGAGAVNVFGNTGYTYSNPRLSFYSIGESLDLAALDTRVSTLMTDIAAAI